MANASDVMAFDAPTIHGSANVVLSYRELDALLRLVKPARGEVGELRRKLREAKLAIYDPWKSPPRSQSLDELGR